MLIGTVPFKASNLEDLHKLILAGVFTIPDTVSQDAQSLIRGMIQLEPTDRLTVPQILAHAWLKETNDESDSGSEQSDD
jgi:serine/threonine protein kinase